ncbi:asparagine synthase (glutamine-hydrolyzing) [Desulfoluna butyratoxydans]|uniref:asparagine synthase (glutamine-hydrolyzing) n=1 Tax=Desulfoluna butyratoxydans TaxID=231438 RepID=A0A4U8YL95_9BACT|nr:asparagine synthase (glutamine-hydrolyzing) [Desulfoluna butyratoxydans]VFQ44451.1 asparagine synthase glutamine-hydrolyzing [Desulfoluna butyratoxydans]
MCGVSGILGGHLDGPSRERAICSMVSTLTHRGPDGWGIYCSGELALGHTRLSIVDLQGGHQPMMSDRFVICYNGEIYNHIELRQELEKKGVTFETTCDTEVALKAFEVYGTDAFSLFNGQFAMLIWDRQKKELVVARDRYGIRPLYVLQYGGAFYFSSEIKAFDTLEGYRRTMDMQALFEHALLWNTMGDSTVYNGIRSVSSGTFERFTAQGRVGGGRYYEIGESCGASPETLEEAGELLESLLLDSVRLRLRSDVPVGAYLSGGIDSSVITHLTSVWNREKFKTFSVAFEDAEFDESFFQREMVSRINSDHLALQVGYSHINEHFLDAVYHFERPVFRTAGVPLFMLSEKVREHGIKVVLTGEGADEILCGYDSFKELKLLEFWGRDPSSTMRPLLIKKLYPHLRHYSNPRQYGLMKMYYEGFLGEYDNELTGLNIRAGNNRILAKYFHKDHPVTFEKERLIETARQVLPDNFSSWTLLQKNQFMEMKTLLSGYLLSSQGDRMSLAHSVEGRYPFLDHRVVEALFYFKDRFKLRGFSQKYLLGKTYGHHLPDAIVNRPKKPYTAPDLKSFFHGGGLSEQAAHFLSPEMLREYGVFDETMVERLVNKFNRQIPAEIGYRDNMLITFILSCQMTHHWAGHPKKDLLDPASMTVRIDDRQGTTGAVG